MRLRAMKNTSAGWYAANRPAATLPWREAEFCVVDVETTGLDLARDDIVSYGAVVVRAGRVIAGTSLYGLVRPHAHVSAKSITAHALRAEDLTDAPPLDHAVDRLLEIMCGRVLVAHAAWVEKAFLGRALRPRRVRLTSPVLDTAALARAAGVAPRCGVAEPSLEHLALSVGATLHTPHHALGDALTTAEIFVVLASRLDRDFPQSVGSLAATPALQPARASALRGEADARWRG